MVVIKCETRVNSVDWSPDGSLLATSTWSYIRVWDAESGKLLKTLTGHTDSVCTVARSPDGTSIASGSFDRTVRIWQFGPTREQKGSFSRALAPFPDRDALDLLGRVFGLNIPQPSIPQPSFPMKEGNYCDSGALCAKYYEKLVRKFPPDAYHVNVALIPGAPYDGRIWIRSIDTDRCAVFVFSGPRHIHLIRYYTLVDFDKVRTTDYVNLWPFRVDDKFPERSLVYLVRKVMAGRHIGVRADGWHHHSS